jgi:ppGpp synthetase/RelA/SpoT-type nucleotidyltranferase
MRVLQVTVDDLGDSYSVRPIPLIQGNVKEFDSFFKKAKRFEDEGRVKNTDDCFKEIRDVARGRIICQTLEDCQRLQSMLADNTDIFYGGEMSVETHEPSETGYRAVHLAIDVGVMVNGKELATPCEVQILTALQFAWNLYTHKDFYKGARVPPVVADLMRELSDLLHVADRLADRLIKEVELTAADDWTEALRTRVQAD